MWYLHYLIPDGVEQVDLGFMVLGSHGFRDIDLFIGFLSYKLTVLIPMIIWYVTCQHWWKYAILSPLILYSYQFWEVFQDTNTLEAFGNLRAFPAIFCVIVLLLLLSRVIKYKTRMQDIYEYVLQEIEEVLYEMNNENELIQDKKNQLINIKKQKITEKNARENLTLLIALKEELLQKVKT
ncbi:MAG: hypothetical protein WBG90_17795 [Saonia sp.]